MEEPLGGFLPLPLILRDRPMLQIYQEGEALAAQAQLGSGLEPAVFVLHGRCEYANPEHACPSWYRRYRDTRKGWANAVPATTRLVFIFTPPPVAMASCSPLCRAFSSAWSMLKLAGRCRGGNSWKVRRNSADDRPGPAPAGTCGRPTTSGRTWSRLRSPARTGRSADCTGSGNAAYTNGSCHTSNP